MFCFFGTDIDECQEMKISCQSHSRCVNSIGSYKCVCNQGFRKNGTQCLGERALGLFELRFICILSIPLRLRLHGTSLKFSKWNCSMWLRIGVVLQRDLLSVPFEFFCTRAA